MIFVGLLVCVCSGLERYNEILDFSFSIIVTGHACVKVNDSDNSEMYLSLFLN